MKLNNTPYSEYVGKTFNRLTIDRILDKCDDRGRQLCECTCHCNDSTTNKCVKILNNVVNGLVKSCGCYRKERYREAHEQNLVGRKFGRLTVLEKLPHAPREPIKYKCVCDCDNHTIVNVMGASLVKGLTKSCGCYKIERISESHSTDFTGFKNEHIEAICPTDERYGSYVMWRCRCLHCGKEFEIYGNAKRKYCCHSCYAKARSKDCIKDSKKVVTLL